MKRDETSDYKNDMGRELRRRKKADAAQHSRRCLEWFYVFATFVDDEPETFDMNAIAFGCVSSI